MSIRLKRVYMLKTLFHYEQMTQNTRRDVDSLNSLSSPSCLAGSGEVTAPESTHRSALLHM